jgi:hypothetical protein
MPCCPDPSTSNCFWYVFFWGEGLRAPGPMLPNARCLVLGARYLPESRHDPWLTTKDKNGTPGAVVAPLRLFSE